MAANDMDGALRRVLQPGGGVVPGCDPELNAAYAERRLRGAEQQKLEAHLAACADCRKLVTEWMAEETPEEAPAPRPAWWRWRWAVPALAGVAVVGSVIVYQWPHREEEKKVALSRQAPALPAEPPPANQPVTTPKPSQARPEFRAKSVLSRSRDEAERFATAPVPAAPPAPQAPALGASQVGQEAQLAKLKEEAGAADRREGDQQQGAVAGLLDQKRSDAVRQNVQRFRAASLLPDGTGIRSYVRRDMRLWAVSEAGRLFRSVDSGASWQPLDTPATVPLVRVEWDASGNVLLVADKEGRSFRIQP